MATKKVTVSGGSKYYVEEKYGKYRVRGSGMKETTVSSMEDALTLIKSDSGKEITRID